MLTSINIYISYAKEDLSFLNELRKFLKSYEKNRTIKVWSDTEMTAGQDIVQWTKEKLNSSQMVLLMISQDFVSSDLVAEVKAAAQDHSLVVVPVVIRPYTKNYEELNGFQKALPDIPISKFPDRDEAWVSVVDQLGVIFDRINGHDSTKDPARPVVSTVLRRTLITDKLLIGVIMLLIVVSLGVLGYGMVNGFDLFYILCALAGMGFGFLGYIRARKFISA